MCSFEKCSPVRGNYDFHQLSLSGQTLTWLPWLQLQDCEVGQICQTSGVLNDIMDILAIQNNFTWYVEKADKWGVVPLTGNWSDPSATFDGTFGLTVRDERGLPLSIWISTIERFNWIDVTMSILDRPIQTVINRRIQPIDLTLFIRPFTRDSWIAIGVTLTVVAFCLLGPPGCNKVLPEM